jgi:hypothetical protein
MLVDRLAWASTATTVALMFLAVIWLQPLLIRLPVGLGIASALAGAAASLGLYRLLSTALQWIFSKNLWLRKLILGKGFLEGTWVGHYIHNSLHFFTIEHIEQATGQTQINGREFDQSGKTRAAWYSDTVSIDTERMRLVYAYTCTVFHRKHVHEGLGFFALIRESTQAAPTKLDGYAVDLIDGDRDPNTEHKISEEPVTDIEALRIAKEKFGVP